MSLERRLTAARADLADERLRGQVEAARYVAGTAMRVAAPSAPLRREPRDDAALDSEALMGEAVTVFEEAQGWAWGQLALDGYVGYLPAAALGPAAPAATHRVVALRSFLYPAPDMKRPPLGFLSFGAGLTPLGQEGDFVAVPGGGFLFARHLAPAEVAEPDYVAVAERFLGTPYLWGGKTSLGLDCSALVQIALAAAGIAAPRDSDLQQAALGTERLPAPDRSGLVRSDLVFWAGHVGIMRDPTTLLHANGHHMAVVSEPLAIAEARIGEGGHGPILAAKRL